MRNDFAAQRMHNTNNSGRGQSRPDRRHLIILGKISRERNVIKSTAGRAAGRGPVTGRRRRHARDQVAGGVVPGPLATRVGLLMSNLARSTSRYSLVTVTAAADVITASICYHLRRACRRPGEGTCRHAISAAHNLPGRGAGDLFTETDGSVERNWSTQSSCQTSSLWPVGPCGVRACAPVSWPISEVIDDREVE